MTAQAEPLRTLMIRAVGGTDLRGYENRTAWIMRAARMCGISFSMASRIWRREVTDPKLSVFRSVAAAAEKREKKTIADIRGLYADAVKQLEEAREYLSRLDTDFRGKGIDYHSDRHGGVPDPAGGINRPMDKA